MKLQVFSYISSFINYLKKTNVFLIFHSLSFALSPYSTTQIPAVTQKSLLAFLKHSSELGKRGAIKQLIRQTEPCL